MDREICARGAVGSLRRFEGEEEEWRGGEEERKISAMASRRGCEKALREGEGEGAERTRVLSSGAHTGAPGPPAHGRGESPRLVESGGAARNERGLAALPAGSALR